MSDQTTIEVVLSSESTVGNPIVETVTVVGTVPIGPRGPAGAAGADGADSTVPGPQGDPGEGVPTGGTDGQVLTKLSATDFDTAWEDPTGGGGGGGTVDSIVAGSNIDVDATDPANPIVSVEALVDADIPASIARDTEVTAAIAALSTVYQPLDSDLTAIAALTTTSFGRSLLALADAAAGRTALGLGTAATAATGDFDAAGSAAAAQAASQPVDSDLTAIAALTTTAYGRSLLAMANAAAVRTSINVEDGATADQTAAEILAALLTVDGAGSGLDADLLDGQSSAAFETPAGAQTKADAKVTQTITNGVTTTAPSEDAVFDALALKAPLASPALTGTPTAPTATQGDSDTSIATTAFVNAEILADAYTPGGTDVAIADGGTGASTAAAAFAALKQAASDTATGVVELATTAETETGTDATRAVTPDGLHDMTTLAGAAWFLDEDAMTSNSATKVPSQQSTKAYVDNEVGDVAADVAALLQVGPSVDGDITWDTTTTPGSALPVLDTRVPRTLLFDEKTAATSNTTAQTSLLDAALVVPANTWAVGSILRWSLSGSITNNTGGNRDVTIRVKQGTDVVFSLVFSAIPTSATARVWRLDAVTAFRTSIGTNLLGAGEMALGATSAAADTIVRTRSTELVAFTLTAQTSWDVTVELGGAASSSLAATLSIGVIEFSKP